jgi:hypothetical protein
MKRLVASNSLTPNASNWKSEEREHLHHWLKDNLREG